VARKTAKKLSARAARREGERAAAKLADKREQLAALDAGGAPSRPIALESASQVEAHARSLRCPRCDGAYRIDEHTAETIDGARLRVVRMTCASCGARRAVYFRLAPPMLH
jgi:hypothetical protein